MSNKIYLTLLNHVHVISCIIDILDDIPVLQSDHCALKGDL